MQLYENKYLYHLRVTGMSCCQLLSDLLQLDLMFCWVRMQIVDKKRILIWNSDETDPLLIYHSKHQTLLFSDHPRAKYVLSGLIKASLLHCSTQQSFYLTINRKFQGKKKHLTFNTRDWKLFGSKLRNLSPTNHQRDFCRSVSHSLARLSIESCARHRILIIYCASV